MIKHILAFIPFAIVIALFGYVNHAISKEDQQQQQERTYHADQRAMGSLDKNGFYLFPKN